MLEGTSYDADVLHGYTIIITTDTCFRGKAIANMELHRRCMFKGCFVS